MTVRLLVWSPAHPGDTSGLVAALAGLDLARVRRLAVVGKVEGPATLNDVSRDLAIAATDAAVDAAGGAALSARTARLFSVGCEGIATPVVALFAALDRPDGSAGPGRRLVFGIGRSDTVPPVLRARASHIEAAQTAVAAALGDAGLAPADAALVLVKSPVRPASLQDRHAGSTGAARGAAALGATLALGEVGVVDETALLRDGLHSERTMAFSGTETDRVEAVVLGEAAGAGGDLRIATAILADLLDSGAALRLAGVAPPDARRLVLLKAGIAAGGILRGRRTTVHGSDIPADKHLRAAASGAVGAWFGPTDAFLSGGAEHQGPPGACLAALVHRAGP